MATIESLPIIDMTTLTQSELRALSLCSTTLFDLDHLDDVVIPIIDRSLFNESAGSRRQTFSRPTTTTTHHHHHHHHLRHRIAGLLPSNKPPVSSLPPHLDPDHLENRTILSFLKQSLSQSPEFRDIECLFAANSGENEHVLKKRKRGRKPKTKVKSLEENLEIVNQNGAVVDIVGLGSLEDPYGEELRRRTEGIGGNEEKLLDFLKDLGGQWCSRRKKRKIVDADLLGNALPVGWKLLLGLKRREGRASVYCRRYISPGGQHFLSCKEVSGYLQSYFGLHDAHQAIHHRGDNIQPDYKMASEIHAGVTQKENEQRQSNKQEKQENLLGIDNLAEVQIHDLFECHKCDMTFDEKDTYLQHLLSFHQRTTRRYRLGSSVGDGVIIKDGKFECQFCHKVFHERRRYNGHVGIHVRNYVRGIEESPGRLTLQNRTESPGMEEFATRISKMDALIEIAQNSILETSSAGLDGKPKDGSTADKLHVVTNSEMNSDHEMNSDSSPSEPEMIDVNLDQEPYLQHNEHMITGKKMEKLDDSGDQMDVKVDSCGDTATTALPADERNCYPCGSKDVLASIACDINEPSVEGGKESESPPSNNQKIYLIESNVNLGCSNKLEHSESDGPLEGSNNKIIDLEIGFGSGDAGPTNDKTAETVQHTLKENIVQYEASESSLSLLHTAHTFPTFNATSSKREDEPRKVDQRLENVTGFEELKLDEIEHLKFNFGTGQESLSLQEVPMELANDSGIQGPYSSSVQFESEEVLLNMAHRHQVSTVCVWCGVEFSHEGVDSEVQSDSVGYMCPACKTKISGQLGDLGSG
ncbi:hypothetical protein ACOSP7_004654 [Xanthoceras sorbifolium]|uniref:Uncharacterized protein n=1 Tax=Xanthoceras sorbifolium TaxID=99658 RepID=A0ABQ8IG13_9ROSI|nr:hypothetical protein JRO89_XS02G0159100 [Xanthoceras sorbifolium]